MLNRSSNAHPQNHFHNHLCLSEYRANSDEDSQRDEGGPATESSATPTFAAEEDKHAPRPGDEGQPKACKPDMLGKRLHKDVNPQSKSLQDNESEDLEVDTSEFRSAEFWDSVLAAKQRIKKHQQEIKKERDWLQAQFERVAALFEETEEDNSD